MNMLMFVRIQSNTQVCVGLSHCCMPNECAFLAWGCRVCRGLFNCAAPPLVNSVTSISPINEVKLAVCSGSSGYTNNPSFIPLFFISLDWLDWTLMLFCLLPCFLLQSWQFRSLHAITFNCILLHPCPLFSLWDSGQCMPASTHNGHMRETDTK